MNGRNYIKACVNETDIYGHNVYYIYHMLYSFKKKVSLIDISLLFVIYWNLYEYPVCNVCCVCDQMYLYKYYEYNY